MKHDLVCPNCGSDQIDYGSLQVGATKTITGLGIPQMYYCPVCGYEGPVILEIDQKHMKKRFQHIPKKPFKVSKPDKYSIEILRPIFTIVILLFLFITALSFIPSTKPKFYTETFEPLPANYLGGKQIERIEIINMPQFNGPVIVEKVASTGEVILEVREQVAPEFDIKTGTESVHTFFIPIFMIIFVLGFIGLMIAKHYQRSLKFI